jgi:2-amino-4-hydroxy-6-hydroxymethyldihydropteridine diphosphokinase
VIARSHLYRTRAWGRTDQPDFINAAVGALSRIGSAELLEQLFALERAAGRPDSREKWSARTLDLDLLVFGSERSDSPERRLPHPGIAERAFVLAPLQDIAPNLRIPGVGRVSELGAKIDQSGIQVLA